MPPVAESAAPRQRPADRCRLDGVDFGIAAGFTGALLRHLDELACAVPYARQTIAALCLAGLD